MVYNASNELMSHQLVTLHPLIIYLKTQQTFLQTSWIWLK